MPLTRTAVSVKLQVGKKLKGVNAYPKELDYGSFGRQYANFGREQTQSKKPEILNGVEEDPSTKISHKISRVSDVVKVRRTTQSLLKRHQGLGIKPPQERQFTTRHPRVQSSRQPFQSCLRKLRSRQDPPYEYSKQAAVRDSVPHELPKRPVEPENNSSKPRRHRGNQTAQEPLHIHQKQLPTSTDDQDNNYNSPREDNTIKICIDYLGSAPRNVQVRPLSSSTLVINWDEPETSNGYVLTYKVYYTTNSELPITQWESKMVANNGLTTISELIPHTIYTIKVQACTSVGHGSLSLPVDVKTQLGVPKQPSNLRTSDIGETSLALQWSKPTYLAESIVSYELYWNDTNAKQKHHRRIPISETYTLTGLYPDTIYYVWLAARSQRGEGATTPPIPVKTKQYDSHVTNSRINNLERGVECEFSQNNIGVSQEAIKCMHTPEGPPTGPPTNFTYYFQTSDVVCISWSPPTREHRNGQISKYDIQFQKKSNHNNIIVRNVTYPKAVFTNLEENTEYVFHVRACTSQGVGPSSEEISIQTMRDIGRAPMSVKAVATSDSSVEVSWDAIRTRGKVIGYKIFYTITAAEDLDEWQQKSVGLTESANIVNLEKSAQYVIAVAAKMKNGLGRLSGKVTVKVKPEDVPLNLWAHEVTTHSMTLSWSPPIRLNPVKYKISFDAVKEFVDSQGITQTHIIPKVEIKLNGDVRSHTINELSPFTTYNVNVSAIPTDNSYRPPTTITVTTQMAAPQPMVKPDFYGVVNGEKIQVILPQASEEYGPISHYYLVVVPEGKLTVQKNPDQFLTDELISNVEKNPQNSSLPYIAAKFHENNIPYTYHLGTGERNDGFVNYRLEHGKRYKIFVRSFINTAQKHIYTSSPFSEFLSLDIGT
ncbi:tyrosine-protein phosphatase Lar-like [Anoplophora glabripennis]|uniref:tyrosine-protein phosphatase Lar-like n=1 Tax=Anoplophora glabripennis TaxID=217634 RepID=UPI000C767A14|nr:tyrosine-protein phosphatase Lar-like [Anoplophora glabripennis]